MAKISLRAYNREIEALIEQGRNDEAIAHCRHILKTFPKCLDTYRLLGKGYLEAHRFTEAEDILKRLLLAVPDDFIGNLGMSILFDEQKNINNSIWHMERAFEVQPSNTAIQGELRRLYGRRDGLEPPQIRLTRGALAQMYARGNQIPQAIGEIRAMLAEDPDRMDLQVLLARVYFRGGQKVEATDACTLLLKKYPYCLDANRIMVEILTDTSRSDSTQIYRHRVNALDPYSAFVAGSLFAAGDVPDAAVSLDQLDFEAGEFASPADLGFDTTAKTAEGLSLADEEAQAPGAEGSESAQTSEPSAAPAEEIPAWLKAAGWGAATAEAVRRAEQGAHEEDIETEASTEAADELAQGEVPDWLQSMAPIAAAGAAGEAGAQAEELEAAEADTDWLAGLGVPEQPEADSSSDVTQVGMGLTGAVVAAAAGALLSKSDDEATIFAEEPESELAAPAPELGVTATDEPTGSSGEGESADWLQETAAAGPGAEAEALESAETDTDWLAGLGTPEQAETDSSSDVTQAGMGLTGAAVAAAAGAMLSKSDDEATIFAEEPESELAGQAAESAASSGEGEFPDAMQVTAVAEPGAEAGELEAAEADTDRLAGPGTPEQAESDASSDATQVGMGLTGAAVAAAAGAMLSKSDDEETISAEEPESEPVAPAPETDAIEEPSGSTGEVESPDWMAETAAAEPGAQAEALGSAEADTDWLAGLGTPEHAESDSGPDATQAGIGPAGAVVAAAAGAMLSKSDDEETISAEEPESEPVAPAPETDAIEEPSGSTGEVKSPDWMAETAAAEPGAQAEELESAEADTDWLAGLGAPEQAESDSSSDATQAEMGPTGAVVAAAAGAMLSKTDDEETTFAEESEPESAAQVAESAASATEEPAETTGEGELPDWLREPAVTDSPPETETPEEEVPDWLKETAVVASLSEAEAPAAEAPDSLKDSVGDEAQAESETGSGELGPLGTAAAVAAMAAGLSGDESEREEVPEGEAEALPGEPASDVSDWLAGLDQADKAGAEEVAHAGEESPIAEPAVGPGAAVEPAEEPAAGAGPEPAPQEGEAQAEPPAGGGEAAAAEVTPEAVAQMSEDEAFAWLESLAAKQGVDPDQLLTKPEERGETAPEWLTQPEIRPEAEAPGPAGVIFAAAAVGEMLSPEHEPGEVTPEPEKAEEPVAGDMDWLEGIEKPGVIAETEAQTPAVSEWLPVESAAEEAATGMPEPAHEETVEQNLVSTSPEPIFEESQAAESGAQPGADEEMPDWLRISLEEVPSTNAEEGVPEWMRAADEAQPSPEEEAETSEMEAELAAAAETSPAEPESGIEIARRTPPEGDDAILEQAQIDLQRGDLEQATEGYKHLIRRGKLLDEIISDLREGTYQHPVDVVIWLTLGDAYRQASRLQEALDAYTKAEELLR